MKEILKANGLDGEFQEEVLGALRVGRAKMRNICVLGPANCGKSFLFRGLLELFTTYQRPDGGSYQLEDLLGAEVVFLNDFEYDTGAKDWMPWSFFKNFLEGNAVKVARPKTRGSNEVFKGTAPVFFTAPREVTLFRRGFEVEAETSQMRKRIKYFVLQHPIPEEKREEVTRVCPHCTARLYLEGKTTLDAAPAHPTLEAQQAEPNAGFAQPPAKRPRTAAECVNELKDLKGLLDSGALTPEEFSWRPVGPADIGSRYTWYICFLYELLLLRQETQYFSQKVCQCGPLWFSDVKTRLLRGD